MTVEPFRIRLPEKLGFGAYAMSIDASVNFLSVFLLFFLTDVARITPGLAGTVLLLGTVWDGINDPWIGYLAINRTFKTGERVRPYAKYFSLPAAALFVALFVVLPGSAALRFVYAVAVYLIYDTVLTFLQIPSSAMSTLASDRDSDRVSINTFIAGGSSVGVILATVGCWPLVNAFSGVDESGNLLHPQRGFLLGALVAACILFAGCLFHYLTSRERVRPIDQSGSKIPIKQAALMLLHSRLWIIDTSYFLFYNLSIIFMTSTIVYYATHVLENPDLVTLLLGAYILSSMAALPFAGMLHKKLGRRRLMILSAALLIASKVYFLFSPTSYAAAIINAVLTGIGVTFTIIATFTNRADIADLIEWNGGRRIENLIATVSSTISKLGVAVCTFSIGLALEYTGYNSELAQQPQSARTAITLFMGLIPMVTAALMMLIAFRFDVETPVAKMRKEKEELSNG